MGGLNVYTYARANPVGHADPLGLQASIGDDSISARAKSLAVRGDRDTLKRFRQQHEGEIGPDAAKKFAKRCERVFKRKAKEAQKKFRTATTSRTSCAEISSRKRRRPVAGPIILILSESEMIDAAEAFYGSGF